jgi:hypothetical protein
MIQLRGLLTDSPRTASGCVTNFNVRAPDAHAGSPVQAVLNPRRLGGRWCEGTYHGKITELQTAVCPHGELCPSYVLVRRRIGPFTLHVLAKPPSDTRAPVFAGLERALACTPGPQRPGQTTPFTLSWYAATDNITPSARISYDIYLTTTSGGEDFSQPTWTATPGTTQFRTPGLPSHGSFYFVVRARDLAGNEDENTVEQHGLDPCV